MKQFMQNLTGRLPRVGSTEFFGLIFCILLLVVPAWSMFIRPRNENIHTFNIPQKILIEAYGGSWSEDKPIISTFKVTGGDEEHIAKLLTEAGFEATTEYSQVGSFVASKRSGEIHMKNRDHPFYRMSISANGYVHIEKNPSVDIRIWTLEELATKIYWAH